MLLVRHKKIKYKYTSKHMNCLPLHINHIVFLDVPIYSNEQSITLDSPSQEAPLVSVQPIQWLAKHAPRVLQVLMPDFLSWGTEMREITTGIARNAYCQVL